LVALLTLALLMPNAFGAKQKPQQSIADGTAVLRTCSFALDVSVTRPRRIKHRRDAFDYGYCMGLVQGTYANASGNYFCPPDGVKTPRVLELVVNFVRAHPDLEQKDGADIVRWALADEYPCPDKDRSADSEAQASVKH
jgi:Rap1a immunity proteins